VYEGRFCPPLRPWRSRCSAPPQRPRSSRSTSVADRVDDCPEALTTNTSPGPRHAAAVCPRPNHFHSNPRGRKFPAPGSIAWPAGPPIASLDARWWLAAQADHGGLGLVCLEAFCCDDRGGPTLFGLSHRAPPSPSGWCAGSKRSAHSAIEHARITVPALAPKKHRRPCPTSCARRRPGRKGSDTSGSSIRTPRRLGLTVFFTVFASPTARPAR